MGNDENLASVENAESARQVIRELYTTISANETIIMHSYTIKTACSICQVYVLKTNANYGAKHFINAAGAKGTVCYRRSVVFRVIMHSKYYMKQMRIKNLDVNCGQFMK